jgi:hypothetical protein
LFDNTTIGFVSGESGPGWAIALLLTGGIVPSLAALALTGLGEGGAGLVRLWQRLPQLNETTPL